MPLRQAIRDGVAELPCSVFDYGCGRGEDLRQLRHLGFDASGWDPHFAPDVDLCPADVVTLTYVLNVIEDVAEREGTLLRAWSLAREVLVVSCRLSWESNPASATEFGDGVATSRETFQHFFTTNELRTLVERVAGTKCVSPVPGVVYVFRSDEHRLRYLAKATFAAHDWVDDEERSTALNEIVRFTESRGRAPLLEELPPSVAAYAAELSRGALTRLVDKAADLSRVAEGRKQSTLNILLFLGTSIFSGRPRLHDLPASVQADIRECFPSYKDACARADRLLLKIRDDSYLRGAMTNSVGKMTASALYVHERAYDLMPVVLRLYEHCGSVAAGRPAGWNILKLDHRGRRVSWSAYPDFDRDPHPTLDWTFGVDMTTLDSKFQSFADRANRPLLHRKEEFISPDDPIADKCKRLTAAEVRAGLYSDPSRIGLEHGWQAELERCGVALKGHRLVRAVAQVPSACDTAENDRRSRL